MRLKVVIVVGRYVRESVLLPYLEAHFQEVRVIGITQSSDEAVHQIRTGHPDLVILDTELEAGSGFEILERTQNQTYKKILVTGPASQGLKAIRYSVTEILQGPIKEPAFLQVMHRVVQNKRQACSIQNQFNRHFGNVNLEQLDYIAVPQPAGTKFVRCENIVRVEKLLTGIRLVLDTGRVLFTTLSLRAVWKRLGTTDFLRTHSDQLINRSHILRFENGSRLMLYLKDGNRVVVEHCRASKVLAQVAGATQQG